MNLNLHLTANNRIHIEKFGPSICGADGKAEFAIVFHDANGEFARIDKVTLDKLFARFDLKGDDFLAGKYYSTDFFAYDPIKKKITGKTDLGFKLGLRAKYSVTSNNV